MNDINKKSYSFYFNYFNEIKFIPCIYCPGNCLTVCPTFISSRNFLTSPFGYVRSKIEAIDRCLQCWRCTFNCPVEYPLPILIEKYKAERREETFSFEVIVEKNKYLVGEKRYEKQISELAEPLHLGVILLKLNYLPLNHIRLPLNKNDLIAYSPEVSFILGIPHYSEILNKYFRDLGLSLKIHIPCLLTPKKDNIVKSLSLSGLKIIDVITDSCVKMGDKAVPEDYYSICPRVQDYNKKSLDRYIIEHLE